jgi:signal transduction histidine kinase
MLPRDTIDLELNIARARLILAPATLLSIYLDAAKPDLSSWFPLTGGPLEIDRYAFTTLLCHLAYSLGTHSLVNLRPKGRRLASISMVIDILFAMIVAIFTEGPTSPSYAFFAFAIIAVGCREGFRATLAVTIVCMLSYLAVIVLSARGAAHDYLMRPIYLGITGYLIGFLGQQRINFETRIRELETREQRHSIARSLHDGYIQALAAVNLRLDGCRKLLQKQDFDRALAELTNLQAGVAREYDEVRSYIHSLIELEESATAILFYAETLFHVQADFQARGPKAEQILLVLLEGVRNTMQHANAAAAVIRASEGVDTLHITIDDDGIGFPDEGAPPWSIASRVADLGGEMRMVNKPQAGARLEIALPAN